MRIFAVVMVSVFLVGCDSSAVAVRAVDPRIVGAQADMDMTATAIAIENAATATHSALDLSRSQQDAANYQATQSAITSDVTATAIKLSDLAVQAKIEADTASSAATAEAVSTQSSAGATATAQEGAWQAERDAFTRSVERKQQDELFWQGMTYGGSVLFLLVLLLVMYLCGRALEYFLKSKGVEANAHAQATAREARARAQGMIEEARAKAKEIESRAFRNLTIVSETTRSVISMGQGGGLVIQPIEGAHLEEVAEHFKAAQLPAPGPGLPKPKFSPATIKLVAFLERCQIKNLKSKTVKVENKQRQITPASEFRNSNWRSWAIHHLEAEGAVVSQDGVGVFITEDYGTFDNLIRAVKTGAISEPPALIEEGCDVVDAKPSHAEG